MIDDLNLEFEDHDRGRGRRRRTERDDRAATTGYGSAGWAGSGSRYQQSAWGGGADPRQQSWDRADDRRGYDTGGYDTGGYGRDPRYDDQPRYDTGGHSRYGDPRYDTGGQPRYDTGGQPGYGDPRYGDPRYDAGHRGYPPEPPPPPRDYDPRYDTGSRAYARLGADDRYGTGSQRRGFLEDGYEDGGFLPGYDDEPPRRSKGGKSKKKRGRGRSFLALFLTLLLLGGLGGGAYLAYDKIAGYFVTPDYDGTGTAETVQIEVKQGQLLGDIANTLVKADVVKSYKAFVEAAERNKNAVNIQPGFYTMHKQMSGEAAVLALLDTKNRNVKGITIPEGMIAIQIYDLLSEKLKIPVADFVAAAKDPKKLGIPDWWFTRGDKKKAAGGIEGFLFPATYEFPPNATAEQALKMMVDHFLTVTGEMKFAENAQKLNISPYEVLIAASIGQAEVVNAVDYPKVARALYNRVYKPGFPCSCLQIDSAVNYWLRITGKVPKDSSQILRGEQHNPKDPYNTFDVAGMPPGPISNPGEAALKGAMSPAKGDWVYFMTTDKEGTMGYATTWEGHCQNYAKAVKNGILKGTC